MSADRFEIHDHGSKLTVRDTKYGSEVSMLRVRSYSRELTVMAGAIRQQARDIAELEVLAEIGRQWNTDSSLAKWFPLTAERVEQDAQEIAKLRADLAAAVAKRDEWAGGAARLSSQLGNLLAVIHRDGGHYESEHGTERACADAETAVHVMRGCVDGFISSANEWRQRAEQAEARLAAIESAPVVASVGHGDYLHRHTANVPVGTLLIARPAKD